MHGVAKNAWVEELCAFINRSLVALASPLPKVRLEALIFFLEVFQVNIVVRIGHLFCKAEDTFSERLVFFTALDSRLPHYLYLRIWAVFHVVETSFLALCAVRIVNSAG